MTSIEVRPTADREDMECDWGTFVHSAPRPDRDGEVGELMIVTKDYIESLLKDGPKEFHGAIHTAERTDGRLLTSCEYHGKCWTWELHDAHWDYSRGPKIYVGRRWPPK